MSRIFTLLTTGLDVGAVTGFARIVQWSDDPTFGSWDSVNSLDLFVKNQSKIPESLVLKVTSARHALSRMSRIFTLLTTGLDTGAVTGFCQDSLMV